MTSSIVVLDVFANAVVLLVLARAIASPMTSPLTRLLISTCALACAWLMNVVFGAMRAPDWTMAIGGAVSVVSIAVVIGTLHVWTQTSDSGETQPGRPGDEGGGGPPRDGGGGGGGPPRDGGGGGDDPSWWPEFERGLALYVAEHEREMRACRDPG